MKHLTNREEEIMEIFWQKGPLYVKDVIEEMEDPKPHYNTVSTIVRGLEDKGFLGHEQFGNTHRYSCHHIQGKSSAATRLRNIVGKVLQQVLFIRDFDVCGGGENIN